MNPIVVGISHKTAPIEIREKFFCTPLQQELLLSELKSHPAVVESLVLSTCNRTEIYSATLHGRKDADSLFKLLFEIKGIPLTREFEKHFYLYEGEKVIRHFLKVTTGLDSLILGEKQILGQVKESVELARKKAMLGRQFNILSNIAIRAGKKAHSETDISFGGVSLSWAAVTMAEKILGSLQDKSVLILGAGKMSELAGEQIRKKGIREIFVMNRTQSCAEALAESVKGEAVSFGDIKEILAKVDVCICSVGAPHYILEKNTVGKVQAAHPSRKLIFVDISMPRNIDPEVSTISNVQLFYIDDLDKVVMDNMRKRQAAVSDVEQIINTKTSEFYRKINQLSQEIADFESYSRIHARHIQPDK